MDRTGAPPLSKPDAADHILGTCPYCGGGGGREVTAREMMFGRREVFTYRECGSCGSLWLADPPADLGPYYADGYYSMQGTPPGERVEFAKRLAVRLALALPRPAAFRLRRLPPVLRWLAGTNARLDSPIADVGSGEGRLLADMARLGFTDLWGFDPFLTESRENGPVKLVQGDIASMPDRAFAAIMLNHSFEHLPDPERALLQLRAKLGPKGSLLIRLPVAGTSAWRQYGANWVALDPPRHLTVPSVTGMSTLAHRTGYTVRDVFFDSWALQFWGSELYARDIPLRDPRSPASGSSEIFTPEDHAEFERQAVALNRRCDGDAAGFLLTAR